MYRMDEIGVDLAQGNKRPALTPQFFQEELAVTLDRRARIVFGESKIQITRTIALGETARARAEAGGEPRYPLQIFCNEKSWFFFGRAPGKHATILADRATEA